MDIAIDKTIAARLLGLSATGKKGNVAAAFELTLAKAMDLPDDEKGQSRTLEEFKREFYEAIDSLPMHPSQAGAHHSISIHEKAFEKMMADEGLREEILEQIRINFAGDYTIAPPAFTTIRFDENGAFSGTAGGSAHMGVFVRESADAFWRKDSVAPGANRKSEARAADERRKEKKAKEKKVLDELLDRLARNRRLASRQSGELYRERFDPEYGGQANIPAPEPLSSLTSILDSLL